MTDLLAAVDAAFVVTSRGMRHWDDPHRGEMPADEEYSRCLDPAKWRIVGARADAWIEVLVATGMATVERGVALAWPHPYDATAMRTDALRPVVPGGLTLVVAHSTLAGLAEAGVTVAVAREHRVLGIVAPVPDCGCDACDWSSQPELDLLDETVQLVVSGRFRQLRRGRSIITVRANGRSAEWPPQEGIDAVLADPTGWDEVSGPAWR